MTNSISKRLYDLLKSDFPNSSENLAKFTRKQCYRKNHNRILKSLNGELYIGFNDEGWLIGAKLMSVACGCFQTWAFTSKETANCEDVTEWFIKEYSEKGMCAYTDMRHVWDLDYKESMSDGTERKCIHCGKSETLKSKMVRKVWWE